MVDLAEVEARMRPGSWEPDGFLTATASLGEILGADEKRMRERGVDGRDLGGRLVRLLEAAGEDRLRPAARVQDYSVQVVRQRGLITCPWAPDEFAECMAGGATRPTANTFRVRHLPSGRTLEGFVLLAHTIEAHGFFGGPGTPFRLDPEDVIAVVRPTG